MSKKIAVAVSVVVLAIILIFLLLRTSSRDGDTKAILATARKGTLRITIAEKGIIQPVRSAVLFSSIPGNKAKIIWMVPEGTFVRKGDQVIKFDETPFIENEKKYAEELRQAEIEFKLKIDGEEKIKKQELEIQKKKTKAMIEEHLKVTANMEELFTNGFITAEELRIAKQKLQDYTYDQKIADVKFEINEKNYPLVVDQALNRLVAVKEKLATARMERMSSSLAAPVDGLVVYNAVPIEGKLRKIQIGDPVWQNQVIASIPEIANMAVILNIPEGRLHQLNIGQNAEIKVDAFPDFTAKGTVRQIGVLAKDEERSSSVKTFEVTILLNGSDLRLRPGMTALVSITSDEITNTLMVPHEAVFADKGRYFCYVLKDNKLTSREVTIGKGNDDFVSITHGLSDGEEVSLVNPTRKLSDPVTSRGIREKSPVRPPSSGKPNTLFN